MVDQGALTGKLNARYAQFSQQARFNWKARSEIEQKSDVSLQSKGLSVVFQEIVKS
jgi:hypothetical protein